MNARPASAPQVVAHRGASAKAPENTLEAFEVAIEGGADVIEFDVRLTGDGHAVVMHDAGVDRTTDGAGLVMDLPLAQVRSLRIAWGARRPARVPTLEEALDACSGRVAVDIEIKNIPGEPDYDTEHGRVVEATLEALDGAAFTGEVLISSFDPLAVARSKELAPAISTGWLCIDAVEAHDAFAYASGQGHDWILPSVASVRAGGPAFPAEVHAAGMRLGTWISDDPRVCVELMRAGVDAVATNDPAAIVDARRAAGLG